MSKNTFEDNNLYHMQETVLMINVAVARIKHAMTEGDDSFTSLSQTFVEIVDSANKIIQATKELEESPVKDKIENNCEDISQRVGNSIVAFQFYDKLSQRMDLVSKTLTSLNELLKDPEKINVQSEWLELQDTIRAKYTLDADQQMFDAVLAGTPVDEALKNAVKQSTEEDIEFF